MQPRFYILQNNQFAKIWKVYEISRKVCNHLTPVVQWKVMHIEQICSF